MLGAGVNRVAEQDSMREVYDDPPLSPQRKVSVVDSVVDATRWKEISCVRWTFAKTGGGGCSFRVH